MRRGNIRGVIPITPIAFARPVDVGGKRVNPARYRTWKEAAGYHVLRHRAQTNRAPLTGPVGVTVVVGPDGVAYSVNELTGDSRPKGIRGDLDNYVKALLDTLQGIAFDDDKQVETITVHFTPDYVNIEEEVPE